MKRGWLTSAMAAWTSTMAVDQLEEETPAADTAPVCVCACAVRGAWASLFCAFLLLPTSNLVGSGKASRNYELEPLSYNTRYSALAPSSTHNFSPYPQQRKLPVPPSA